MIWRARQASAVEPFAATRRDSPDPRPRRHRRDKSRSAAQARRPETIGFHLLIRQSSPITILVAKMRPEFVANMARQQPRGRQQLFALIRAGEIGIPLSDEDQPDPEQSIAATIVRHPRRNTSRCETGTPLDPPSA